MLPLQYELLHIIGFFSPLHYNYISCHSGHLINPRANIAVNKVFEPFLAWEL